MIADAQLEDVRQRFGHKQANLASILPSVAGPVLGGYLGKRYLGAHLGEELGPVVGAITGGVGGRLLAEGAERQQQPQFPPMASMPIPAGAPYALDPSAKDIPPWALTGANLIQPIMKQGGHLSDILGGDILGSFWTAGDALHRGDSPASAAKQVAGAGVGTIGGGLLGHGAGALINHLAGRDVKLPGGIPLEAILAGAGAAAGNFKGLQYARR